MMRAATLLLLVAACDQGARVTPKPQPPPTPTPTVQGIRGTVTGSGSSPIPGGHDPEPHPLPQVTIRVVRGGGTEVGRTVTDAEGRYSLEVAAGPYEITFDGARPSVECHPQGAPAVGVDVKPGAWLQLDHGCEMYFK